MKIKAISLTQLHCANISRKQNQQKDTSTPSHTELHGR